MFKIREGYFSNITCPLIAKNEVCNVINCIFNHPNQRKRTQDGDDTSESKKIKATKDISILLPKSVSNLLIPRNERSTIVRKLSKYFQVSGKLETPNRSAIEEECKLCLASKSLQEYNRKVERIIGEGKSDIDHSNKSGPVSGLDSNSADPRFILPREIIGGAAPAMLPERKKYIQAIVDIYKSVKPDLQTPIRRATEDEYQIAIKTSKNTYAQTIKKFAFDLKKNPEHQVIKDNLKNQIKLTDKELISRLSMLVIPKEKLLQFGYIVDVPAPIVEAEQLRTCKRCNIEFKLGEQLELTSTTKKCLYHSGRNKKKDLGRAWTCCGGIVGDCDECCVGDHHVFHWSTPEELNHSIPFTHTNNLPTNKRSFSALGLDCEMGYTTLGFELLRTTVIDFLTGEEVLDILVKPKGKVIDLNTKWSGIADIKEESVTFEDHLALLNQIMDKNTILVGHGLENDLNAMRIIHEKVVDTAILYPKHKTSPQMRFSLKYLCFTYLGRTIQTGEHDSGEDSLGAIDIVKYFLNKEPPV